jgi:dTDP-glucose 4,6-dehydratase
MGTGGAGFIGSALVRHLVEHSDSTILTYDKLTYSASAAALAAVEGHPRHRFVRGDICDGERLAGVLAEFQPDALVNLAAETHVDRSIDGPAEFVRTNLLGTFTLIEQVRAHLDRRRGSGRADFRLLHVSTDEVFGSLGEAGSFSEASPYDPRSPYAATKAGADHLVRAWGHTFGLPVMVTQSCNNYGPFQFPEKLVPLTISRALSGAPLPVFGDGGNVRAWLFVDDHVRALRRVLERGVPGESYAIGGSCERTNLAMVRAICERLDRARPLGAGLSYADKIEFVADRPGHDWRYALDSSKIRQQLGWQAETDIERGLDLTIDWYLANESWWGGLVREGYTDRVGLAGCGAKAGR